MDEAARLAYGCLGIKPWELGRYTPHELTLAIEGRKDLEEREQERIAWLAAHLLQPHTEKRLTPDMLLNRKSKKTRRQIGDQKELKKEYSEIVGELEG